ncbi:MAG: hypothetical protein M3N82_17620 [Pseudomonadota bacterium]|nr:hypothetical protein [Pseudomonadota bacterium]
MEVHNIYLIGGEDDEAAEFIQSEREGRCSLACTYRGKHIEASADDFFEALCELRLHLEADGLIPFCYGASLNVFPSAMSRQMSSGLAAYRTTFGKQALRSDLVQIFAEGHDVIPASVENQRKFFDDWLKSLR